MIVRGIDGFGDWLFGKGKNDYKKDIAAVSQNIKTRLSSFLGNCFFDAGAGIDWFTLIGGKNELALNLAIKTTILNTENVTGIRQLYASLDRGSRRYTIQYQVQTAFSTLITDDFVYDVGNI